MATKKDTEEVLPSTTPTEEVSPQKQAYAFPELGKTIEAESLEDAVKQL